MEIQGSAGCAHYRRRCKIRAPCCGNVFPCRHCHNETMSDGSNCHQLPRRDIKRVICSMCGREQPVVRSCMSCGTVMGQYFCGFCKFYDDDVSKRHFHCSKCGICRVGGRNNFFHCDTCGCCYSNDLKDNHICVENSLRHECAICFEYLFDSLKPIRVMICGHTIHLQCFKEMDKLSFCPICRVPI